MVSTTAGSSTAGTPSTRALAADLGLARGTVTEAYAQLTAEGWLDARQGAATTVAQNAGGPARTPAPTPAVTEARPRHDFQPGSPDLSGLQLYPRTNLRFGCAPLCPRTKLSDPVCGIFASQKVFPMPNE